MSPKCPECGSWLESDITTPTLIRKLIGLRDPAFLSSATAPFYLCRLAWSDPAKHAEKVAEIERMEAYYAEEYARRDKESELIQGWAFNKYGSET